MSYTITPDGFIHIHSPDISFDKPVIKSLLEQYNNALILSYNARKLLTYIPETITKLKIALENNNDNSLDNLPHLLKELYITIYSDEYYNISLDNLPVNLEILEITSAHFNQSMDYLPSGLKKLSLRSMKFNQPLNNLPSNLESLSLLTTYNKYIHVRDNVATKYEHNLLCLPVSIKNIKIDKHYLETTNIYIFKKRYPLAKIDIDDYEYFIVCKFLMFSVAIIVLSPVIGILLGVISVIITVCLSTIVGVALIVVCGCSVIIISNWIKDKMYVYFLHKK